MPNHLIREAAYDLVAGQSDLECLFERSVQGIVQAGTGVELALDDGSQLRARLMVATDSRFSQTRRLMGNGARSFDHRKQMLACRIVHEQAHGHVALEWFDYGHTLALLPLNGK